MKILLIIILTFWAMAVTIKQPILDKQAADPLCWARSESIWSVPCGYAFFLSEAKPFTPEDSPMQWPSVQGFAPTYQDAKRQIQEIFEADKQRGLVRKCQ